MTSMSQLRGTQNYIYSLNDVLGQGATGAVYKARHKKTGEMYALKVFNQMSQLRPLSVQMREFEVLRKLKHENIVRLLAIEEESSQKNKVLVMELCTEGSLHHILDQPENGHGLSETDFLDVLHDVAAGMKHLHDNGIVHRDIKPGNIMKYVGEDGKAVYKLIDFGAARELEEEEQFMSLYGTEEYLHPDMYERAVLRRPVGRQFSALVDLWSLGVTLYHVASGQLPFRPFGGRRNKETMYEITTKKKSGVISGVQRQENGPILWSEKLPDFCKFSQGAKLLIVPVLAGLMECDPHKMWTFEKFFQSTHSILQKRVVHVFNLAAGSLLHIYINPEQRMAKLQELIAEQTDIRAIEQYMLFENVKFSDFIEPMEMAKNYPPTSDISPVFLFPSNADSLNLPPVPIPEFLPINTLVQLDQDLPLAKLSASNICYIKRKIDELIDSQGLISKASNMYIVVLIRHLLQVQGFVSQFNTLIEELGRRHSCAAEMNDINVQLLRMLRSAGGNGVQLNLTDDDCNEMLMKSASNQQIYKELVQNTHVMKSRLEEYYDKVVTKRELSHMWTASASLGCQSSDNCREKLEILCKAVQQTMNDFKRNKQARRLTYNEEQIHKFEKSKLNMYVTKSLSVIQSHCDPNLKKVYRSFAQWFQNASEMKKTLENYERKISELAMHQRTLSEVLDNSQKQHADKLRHWLTRVQKTSPATQHPQLETPANQQTATAVDLSASQGAVSDLYLSQSAMTRSQAGGGSRDNARELIRKLNNAMRTMKSETDSISQAVNTNSELLESLSSFVLPKEPLSNF